MGKGGRQMRKATRLIVYGKFGGRCAYTGKPLDEKWQVDHMEPLFYARMYERDPNRIQNLVPALRIVNHYKRMQTVEQFRQYMLTFHIRLKKVPKVPRVEKSAKRKEYMLKVAEAFGITPEKPFSGKFFFETEV
jgi:hypothetical protein